MADPGGGTLGNVERRFSALRLNVNPIEAEAIAFFVDLLRTGKINDDTILYYYNNILDKIRERKERALYNSSVNKQKIMDKLLKYLTYYKVLVQKIIKPYVKYPDLKPSVASVNNSISEFTPIQLIAYFYSDEYKRILAYSPYRKDEATQKLNPILMAKLNFLPIPEEMLNDNFKGYITHHFVYKPWQEGTATTGLANHTPWKTYYNKLVKETSKVWDKSKLERINETFLSELWFIYKYLAAKLKNNLYLKLVPDIDEIFIRRVLANPAVKQKVIEELEERNKVTKSGNILYLVKYLKDEISFSEALGTLISISGGKRKRTRKAKRKTRRRY